MLIAGGRRGAGHVTRAVSRSGLQAHAVRAPVDRADIQTLVGCGRALVNERIAIVEPESRRRLACRPGRRGLGQRTECRARLLAKRRSHEDEPERAISTGKTMQRTGCEPATSASSMKPANCSSPAGSRTSSSSAASIIIRRISSTRCKRCIRRSAGMAARHSRSPTTAARKRWSSFRRSNAPSATASIRSK